MEGTEKGFNFAVVCKQLMIIMLLLLFAVDIDFGDTPTHQTLLIGQEGKVKCTPKAKPSPQVDWFKNQVSLVNGKSLLQ